MDVGYLVRDLGNAVAVGAELQVAHERLARELEQDALERSSRRDGRTRLAGLDARHAAEVIRGRSA
jgi:hypothetical protein